MSQRHEPCNRISKVGSFAYHCTLEVLLDRKSGRTEQPCPSTRGRRGQCGLRLCRKMPDWDPCCDNRQSLPSVLLLLLLLLYRHLLDTISSPHCESTHWLSSSYLTCEVKIGECEKKCPVTSSCAVKMGKVRENFCLFSNGSHWTATTELKLCLASAKQPPLSLFRNDSVYNKKLKCVK